LQLANGELQRSLMADHRLRGSACAEFVAPLR